MKQDSPPTTIGNIGEFTTPSGSVSKFIIVDEVSITRDYSDGKNQDKYHKLIQVLKFDDGEFGLRIGYYRYNPEKDAWIWGQYTQVIGIAEWEELYQKAKEKGFFEKYKNPDNSY